ncbi:hypothetical protein [Agrobacterium radiobacter]|uniref:hypothetical protein n=1 Tax=Agrobacterium radiobacter TaxID=362 RepID=UPI003CE4CA04
MNDTLLCGEVVGNAVTLVEDFAGGAIGDGGDGTFAGAAADRFYTAMVDRHAGLPIKRAGRKTRFRRRSRSRVTGNNRASAVRRLACRQGANS